MTSLPDLVAVPWKGGNPRVISDDSDLMRKNTDSPLY